MKAASHKLRDTIRDGIKPLILFEDLQLFYFLRTIFCSNENPTFCIDQFQSWRKQLLFHFKYLVTENSRIGIFMNIYSLFISPWTNCDIFANHTICQESEQIVDGVNKTVDWILLRLRNLRYYLMIFFNDFSSSSNRFSS